MAQQSLSLLISPIMTAAAGKGGQQSPGQETSTDADYGIFSSLLQLGMNEQVSPAPMLDDLITEEIPNSSPEVLQQLVSQLQAISTSNESMLPDQQVDAELTPEALKALISKLNHQIQLLQEMEPSAQGGDMLPLGEQMDAAQRKDLQQLLNTLDRLPLPQLEAVSKQAPALADFILRQQALLSLNTQVSESFSQGSEVLAIDGMEWEPGGKLQQQERLATALAAMRQELGLSRQSSAQTSSEGQASTVTADSAEGGSSGAGTLFHSTSNTVSQQPLSAAIHQPVNHPRWSNSFSERVVWMINNNMKEADIKLNPANLGAIEVKLSLQEDKASVAFNVQTPQAREALESALPRLREMLAESGIQLNDASVSDHSAQHHGESQHSGEGGGNSLPVTENNTAMEEGRIVSHVEVNTGVDLYI